MKTNSIVAILFCSFILTGVLANKNLIKDGTHPKIRYNDHEETDISEGPMKDMTIKYRVGGGSSVNEYDDTPRYFLLLDDEDVEEEVQYRSEQGQWSERVVLEKMYFCMLFGTSGLPRLSEAPKEVQKLESVKGWDILERDSDYCTWEGISCDEDGDVIAIRLGSFNLGGTIPSILGDLETLKDLDLRGKNCFSFVFLGIQYFCAGVHFLENGN